MDQAEYRACVRLCLFVGAESSYCRRHGAGLHVQIDREKDRYDLIADGRKLLFRSITNACINFTTRLRLVTEFDEDEGWQKSLMDVREAGVESKALGKEMEQKIEEGLLLLTFEQRSAIQLKIVGASTEEIAKALKITKNHAGVLIHRARQSLAKHLAPMMEEQIV